MSHSGISVNDFLTNSSALLSWWNPLGHRRLMCCISMYFFITISQIPALVFCCFLMKILEVKHGGCSFLKPRMPTAGCGHGPVLLKLVLTKTLFLCVCPHTHMNKQTWDTKQSHYYWKVTNKIMYCKANHL